MRTFQLVIPLLTIVALTGCGKDYCDRVADVAEDCGEEISDADLETCREQTSECNGKDNDLLNEYVDCILDAGALECPGDDTEETTTTGTDDDDDDAFIACAATFVDLSDECLQSLMGQ